jgi:hypothetical protein
MQGATRPAARASATPFQAQPGGKPWPIRHPYISGVVIACLLIILMNYLTSSHGAASQPSGLKADGPLDVGCKMTGTPGYTSYGAVVTLWNPGSSPQSLSEFMIDWGSNGVLLSQDPVTVSAEIAPGTADSETVSAPASATSCVFAGWNP